MQAAQRASHWIDRNSRVLQRDYAENRLGVLGAKDDLRNRLRAHETDAGETIIHLNRPSISHFIDRSPLAFDAGRFELARRSHAIDRAGVDEKFAAVRPSAAGEA